MPTIALRFGMVLSADGGALRAMLTPFKWGMGGIIGSGQQFISWIATDDVVRAIAHLMQTPHATGPFNFVAPHPIPFNLPKRLERFCIDLPLFLFLN